MSNQCISNFGRFDEHYWSASDGGVKVCRYCGLFDHSELTDALEAAQSKLALIEVTVALWEAGARDLSEQAVRLEGRGDSNAALDHAVRARVLRAHAEAVRDILKGE